MKCWCKQQTTSRAVMGRVGRISIFAAEGSCAAKAVDTAFMAVERFEQLIDRHNQESALFQLCSATPGTYLAVPDLLWRLLRLANEMAYRTDGLFDIVAAGSGGAACWTDIDLSVPREVRLRKPVNMSVGGMAKGFAVDLAVATLKERGIAAGLVDIGGCIRAFGARPWRIDFNANRRDEEGQADMAVPLILQNAAFSGLGQEFGRARLIDIRSGRVSSTAEWGPKNMLVRAPTCAVADGLAKVAATAPDVSEKLLAPYGAEAIMLDAAKVSQRP
ncbi:MAG: FAD:protein FMN transferase [Kordiimonadaceae bacterium]|nr:FAD:protein FMN transferase [Kordiimonadaceae bacterium]